MSNIKVILSLIFVLFMSRIHAQTMDLNSVIAYALSHNYDYKKQQLDKSITYEKTFEVLTMGFPKVTGNVGYQNMFELNTSVVPGEFVGKPETVIPVQFGTKNNATASVNVQQLIFDGRYLVGVQARNSIKELANSQVKMSETNVKELISKSFYQAIILNSSLSSLKASKEIVEKLYSDAQKVYKQGLIEELDVERLQFNLETIQNTISQMNNQAEVAMLALKLNMAYPLDSQLNIIYDINGLDARLNEFKLQAAQNSTAFLNREEIKLISSSIDVKKYDVKQLKYGYLPSLYGSFNYGYQAFRPSFNYFDGGDWYKFGNFGIQLSIPIFDGLTRKSQVAQTKMELDKLFLEKEKVLHGLKLQAVNSKLNLLNAIEDYENQSNIFKLSEKIERKTQIKYKEGVGSSYEFANAQNDRIQQYLKLLQSKLKILTSYTDFQKANGQL